MIYVCEYKNRQLSGQLLAASEAAGIDFLFPKRNEISGDLQKVDESEKPQHLLRQNHHLYQRLTAWLLLRYALERETGIRSISDLGLRRKGSGKPYSTRYPDLQFNLSHCDSGCACVLSKNAQTEAVGIDMERPFPYREKLMKKICSGNELVRISELETLPEQEKLRLLWSMKESFVKCDGRGLGYGMKKADVSAWLAGADLSEIRKKPVRLISDSDPITGTGLSGIGFPAAERTAESVSTAAKQMEFLVYLNPSYTLAVFGRQLPNEVRVIHVDDLLRKTGIDCESENLS